MLSEKKAKDLLLHILLPLLIAVLSCTVLSTAVPKSGFIQSTVESVDDSKTTVLEFTGATLAASLVVSALPGDFATPIADEFSGMGKYCVVILVALFVEQLILAMGVKLSFLFVIPTACILFIVGYYTGKGVISAFAKKIAILGIALVIVVPCSVKFTNYVGAEYLSYVDDTIEETNSGANTINEQMTDESDGTSILDKISDGLNSAIKGASELLDYFKNMIKKCINCIVILIITNFLMPILTLLIFRWLLKEVFGIAISTDSVTQKLRKNTTTKKNDMAMIEEEE